MKEHKYIKLGKAYIEDEVIKVVIEEQSHRCEEFGNYGIQNLELGYRVGHRSKLPTGLE